MPGFLTELRRRNVIRVAIAYVIVAWLVLQVADVVGPMLELPDWAGKLTLFLLVVGLPVALILAWAFELTPEGLKKEAEVDRSQSITTQTGRKLDFIIIGILAAAVVFFAVDKFVRVETEQETMAVSEGKRSIAVLPFANRSALAQDIFFVDGVHDDILSQLSRINSLKVISRTSVERFRDTEQSMQEIGQALGASSILEGAVQRAGERVRINVQLIDTATDEHLWADTYDRELTVANIFAIQSEIATAIAEELRATLSPDEQERLATVPTESLPALEAYFLGRQRMAKRASGPLAEATKYFQRAIELDPDFALAHVGLADTYLLQAWNAGLPQDEMNAKAEVAIEKALELDKDLGEAYASLGILRYEFDPESAEAAFIRALELNPNYASAHDWYSKLLADFGRFEDSLTHSKIAVELDPLSTTTNHTLAWTYIDLGWFDEAMAQFKSTIAIDPEFPWAYDGVGSLYRRVYGQLDKAVPWYEKMVTIDPGNSNGLAWLGLLVLDIGDDEKAEYWIDRSRGLAPDGFDAYLGIHILHMYRGEDEQAAEYANKVLNTIPREWSGRVAAAYLRDRDLQAGRISEARERYAMAFPELLDKVEPRIDRTNYGAAINLALVLFETGEQERADALLDSSLAFLATDERLGYRGYWVADVQAYALLGKTTEALAALREAIDSGWRSLWWYYLERDKNMDSIRDEPEYQAMLEEVRADMASQLARLREMESSDELALP